MFFIIFSSPGFSNLFWFIFLLYNLWLLVGDCGGGVCIVYFTERREIPQYESSINISKIMMYYKNEVSMQIK